MMNIARINSKTISMLPIILMGMGISLFTKGLLHMAELLGHNIPQNDLTTDYGFAVIWAMILGCSILLWPVPSRDRKALLWIWIAKSLVALGFMLFYEANYTTLDAYYFFASSSTGSIFPGDLKPGAGTTVITAIAWLHNQVLPYSYHALKITFSMVGLVAIYIFYRSALLFIGRENIRLLYILALFPSVLFWSSILGKDPFVLLGIAIYTYGVVCWYRFRRGRYLFMIAAGVMVAAVIRVWMGPILLFPLLILLLRELRGFLPRLALVALLVWASLFFVHVFMDKFSLGSVSDIFEASTRLSRAWSHGGSGQEIGFEFTGIGSMVAFIPLGAFTALFRPLPGEVNNLFALLSGLENLLLLFFALLALKRTGWRRFREPLVTWAVLLIMTWATLYGFVSYQNLGTAVRFKLQILPVLLILLIYLARPSFIVKNLSLPPRAS